MTNHHFIPPFRRALARHHPSAFLLAAQLISLVLYALLEGSTSGRAVISAFGGLVLALVIWVVTRSPAVNWVAWVLAIPAFTLSLASALTDLPMLVVAAALLEAALYFYTVASLIAYMMADSRVTTDELYAAASTFTLLAWGFAFLYQACQAVFPGSFVGGLHPDQAHTFLELLFVSFTNITATGFGDIMAVSSPARILVILEQFTGVAYVTMVISRLIGMTIGQSKHKGK
ncbi:MAG: hypothetical protein JW757_11940 [Anaerolineales bacterium]|nr:hypothetical protein [Anaerolineales bacterium]